MHHFYPDSSRHVHAIPLFITAFAYWHCSESMGASFIAARSFWIPFWTPSIDRWKTLSIERAFDDVMTWSYKQWESDSLTIPDTLLALVLQHHAPFIPLPYKPTPSMKNDKVHRSETANCNYHKYKTWHTKLKTHPRSPCNLPSPHVLSMSTWRLSRCHLLMIHLDRSIKSLFSLLIETILVLVIRLTCIWLQTAHKHIARLFTNILVSHFITHARIAIIVSIFKSIIAVAPNSWYKPYSLDISSL